MLNISDAIFEPIETEAIIPTENVTEKTFSDVGKNISSDTGQVEECIISRIESRASGIDIDKRKADCKDGEECTTEGKMRTWYITQKWRKQIAAQIRKLNRQVKNQHVTRHMCGKQTQNSKKLGRNLQQ